MNIKQINSISEIPVAEWNALAGYDYPFLRHEFLSALELSGSVSAANGWQAKHLLVYDDAELVALCPLYIKAHSQGEFVFDQQWAQAYHQQGFKYYPKLLTAVPFTPCQGQRILFKKGLAEADILQVLFDYIKQSSLAGQISSWHCLFSTPAQTHQLQKLGLLIREGVQFQWFNHQYRDFQDYCSTFASRKRKNIQRERLNVQQQGIRFLRLNGTVITEQQWQVFFKFYQMTYLKHGMSAYLNLDFFKRIALNMPEQILMLLAVKDQAYVGAALSLVGSDTLYGRYWGCFEEYPLLHFEACYYQGLDYCIENALQRFDSGAQGEHKIARGFQPITTYSAHWIQQPEFESAISRFLEREKELIRRYKIDSATLLPFKKSGGGSIKV